MLFDQREYSIRFEWGLAGLARLLPGSEVIIIVDVLSFSTCVDVAVARGARVYPYRFQDASAGQYARSLGAELAGHRSNPEARYSLSPVSLLSVPAGARLVLPSPNGATLSLATGGQPTLTGCLRNARAVAQAARRMGDRITVIAAGERWEDGSLRPGVEDLLGSGAILSHLDGEKSPEALAAEAAFQHARGALRERITQCSSGRELIEKGFLPDVELAVALNTSESAPHLQEAGFYA